MIKYSFSCLFVFLSFIAYPQLFTTVQWQGNGNHSSDDSIYYRPDKKLSWKDFQGTPDNKSIALAITSSGFGYDMAMRSRNGKATLVITVNCFFNKKTSWVKQNMKSNYALVHEQHHFDITYIAACLFVKKLKAANFTMSNYTTLLEQINDESYALLEKMQDDYDGQTKNGQLKDMQAEWNKRIEENLAALITD